MATAVPISTPAPAHQLSAGYDGTAAPAPLVAARGVSDDLASLSDQTPTALTDALAARYDAHEVYTHCGLLTLAVNPYAQVPGLYGPETQRKFYGIPKHAQRPHVYAVAENAYQALLSNSKENQTIVITGESGSGKTVSCNHIIEYLAVRGMATHALGDKLAQASAVLEAFGNAPTIHNANSSRYAKVVNIHFDASHELVGASISTFLLERGRVTEERPFHIISLLREKQRTGVPPPALENVYKGLTELGIKDQEGMWAVLRGIDYLMAGQMDEAAAELGLDAKELEKTLQKRSFKAGTDSFESARSKDELRAAQHGLVRSLYSWVFDWLVTNINAALDAPQTTGPYISLVDIFGFESFKSNALAQFLINWANEQLQRQLSKDVLEAQAEAFAAEGIDFGAPAVQPSCLDLLSNKPGKPGQTGIAFLLDDQSRRQSVGLGGSDAMFANNIGTECYSLYGLVTKRANAHPHEFTVVHYGHDVTYDTRGFLEANSERVDDNLRKLLSQSGASYIRDLVDPSLQQKATPGRSAFTSIVSSFRRSLEKLNTLLISTNVHYIHCIKSNHQAAPWLLERDSVELQVEATGITQIARFARECGPYLVKRDDMSPYLLVLDNYDDLTDATQQLAAIVGDPDGKAVQLGQTHVFFRAAALSKIESKLSAKIKIVVALQSCARRSLSRARYIAVRDEARRVAEEKRREAERKRAEAEAAKRRAEEQRRRAEEERKRSEEEKKRAELRAAKEAAAAAHAVQRARRTSNQDPSLSPQRTTRRLSRRTSTDSFTTQMSPSSGRRTPLSSLNNSTMITTPGTDTPPRTPKTQRGPSPGRLSIAAMRRARSQALPLKEYTASCMRTPDSSELRSAPFYNKTVMHDLIQDLVRSATDYESAFTAGSLLARTVSWFHDADLRYVPELLTPLLLQSVRNDIGPAPELAHLWLLAVLSHSFRLDAGHRPARHLGTVEKELLDLVIKHVYAVSKQILDAVLPGKDGAAPATQADITQLLNGVWASIEKLPVSIREATAQAVLGRVLQIVIQNILLKEITEENAVALRVNLQPMFNWRDNVNLPTSALETVVSAMLASLSGDSEPAPGFSERLAALLDQKHTKHPTNNANAALRALTDHPGVDIQGTLDEALRADDSDFSCDAVMANAPKLSPLTPAMGQFLGWISLFNI